MQKTFDKEITQFIKEEVRKQLRRNAMARTRDEFINALVDQLVPAMSHHYRQTLAHLNNRTDQAEKWRSQEENFLGQFLVQLSKPVKAKGLDLCQAIDQALKELMQKDELRRRLETRTFQKCFKLEKLKPLPEDAHEPFLEKVQEMVEDL